MVHIRNSQVSRKRTRPSSSAGASSERRPRPLSYNETLLADKAFLNPHGSETMADAFGIVPPFSFLLDVDADDRTWGSAGAAAAALKRAGEENLFVEEDEQGEVQGEVNSRSWFYDTVRDRQNRLWADTRVKKGVELARRGQHQVRYGGGSGVFFCRWGARGTREKSGRSMTPFNSRTYFNSRM